MDPFIAPTVEQDTRNGIQADNGPIILSENVCKTKQDNCRSGYLLPWDQ